MHILATFATLCCQTRWPRNHSCTTQEHVSFFRDIFGHFRKFRLFRHFRQIWQKPSKTEKNAKNTFSQTRACSQNVFTNLHMSKNFLHKSAHVEKLVVHKSDKCANVQKTVVHKMRKSAAQIIFQMQKSQICTVHKNTNANFCTWTILSVQLNYFVEWTFLFVCNV